MIRRALIASLTFAALTGVASAQELERPWLDPEAEDVDAEAEAHSNFWERAITPNREDYQAYVTRAQQFMRSSDPQSRGAAETLLRDAIRLAPDQPAAHWMLAHLHYQMGKWKECAEGRARVAELDPEFKPPSIPGAPSSVEFGLGICLSLSGDHAAALEQYKRMMARGGFAAQNSYALRWRMGEAYMALGRLGDAIASLKEAKRLGRMDLTVHYALAAAYDRNEQFSKAREALADALYRDPGQSHLARSDIHISPPEDVHYYIALARLMPAPKATTRRGYRRRSRHKPNPIGALVKFRHFLAEHDGGPWARRASHHIKMLSDEPLSTAALMQHGSASVDLAAAGKAIEKAHDRLQACVKETPGVVYTVETTMVLAARRGRRATPRRFGGAAPVAGVRTKPYAEIETPGDEITAALDCLDREASTIAMPKPSGTPGSSVVVGFKVVAQ
jgi:tetratricopeptide (TPR) repeat protein